MSKKYIIGIDGGSQSTKVVMYDLEGNVVCEGKGLLQPMHTPDADTAEHPDDDLWASLCFAGHDLMSQFAGNKEDIVGIGLGSIRCCRALLKADGTPAAPLISWQDARVTRPYEHTNPDVAYVTSFSGYLTHRLTGEFKDNIANYFGQWPVDYKSWAWSEDAAVMDKFNIPRHMLFDVQMPGTVLGHITPQAALATHFPAGLPVVCTTSDKPVEALGLYPDYATAVDKMVRVKDIFMPVESNAKRYDAMNKGIFKDLTKHTDVILKKSYEVMHGELGNADSIQSWSNV
ncbi:hypothetical protein V9S89_001697 [Escherichia coli]|nr:hypothetical protein [Escherichia coli]